MARKPAPGTPRARPPRAAAPREVRIIGGHWKRTKLPVADKPGLRPTPDRVRETLFNWLDHDLSGWRCVDVFAGTGALGLEAASRGAAEVLLVEQDADLVGQLRALLAKLSATSVKVERANGLSVLGRIAPGSMDLIFLDPPFDADVYEKALAAAAAALAPEGVIYLEAPTAWEEPALAAFGLTRLRHLRAGAVHAHLLQRAA
jgi:16S rRNA (guanine966-N2)-methyltransferase